MGGHMIRLRYHLPIADAAPTHVYTTAPTGPIYATATDDTNTYDADPVWPDLLPNAPDELDGEAVSGQAVTLAWTDNSGIEDGFLIEQAEGSGDFAAVAFAPADAETFTLAGPFDPATTYHFRVSALSGSTVSDPTSTINLTTPAVPDYPTDLTASADSASQITLAWTDHAADDEDYTVQRSADGGDTWTTISLDDHETGHVDTDLDSGTRYSYRVFASNSAGDSGYAAAELATLPEAPAGLTATAGSFRRIDLAWDAVSGNDITGYNIYRSTTDDFTPAEGNLIDTAFESSYSDTTVPTGDTYYYKVIALTGDGVLSDASLQDDATLFSAAPSASGDTSVDEGSVYTVTLSANGNPATGWTIYWADGSKTDLPCTKEQTTLVCG